MTCRPAQLIRRFNVFTSPRSAASQTRTAPTFSSMIPPFSRIMNASCSSPTDTASCRGVAPHLHNIAQLVKMKFFINSTKRSKLIIKPVLRIYVGLPLNQEFYNSNMFSWSSLDHWVGSGQKQFAVKSKTQQVTQRLEIRTICIAVLES